METTCGECTCAQSLITASLFRDDSAYINASLGLAFGGNYSIIANHLMDRLSAAIQIKDNTAVNTLVTYLTFLGTIRTDVNGRIPGYGELGIVATIRNNFNKSVAAEVTKYQKLVTSPSKEGDAATVFYVSQTPWDGNSALSTDFFDISDRTSKEKKLQQVKLAYYYWLVIFSGLDNENTENIESFDGLASYHFHQTFVKFLTEIGSIEELKEIDPVFIDEVVKY